MLEEFEEMLEERSREALPNVLFVSSECVPLAKTGGLADVVGTLPKYLKKFGMDARVITPYHRITKEKYGDKVEHLFHFYVDLGWRHEYAGIEKLVLDGITIYLVDSEAHFGDSIYRGGSAEIEQYAFFQRAVLDAMPNLDFEPEIVHCNDWQAAMIPMLARTQYRGCMQEKLKYLLSIHNIAFQGRWGFDYIKDLLNVDPAYFTPEFMELYGDADFLKAGCVFSDRLSTVSPNYANEIKTPYFAEGLEGILNARSAQLSGILNGIDTSVFNPESDKLIPASFNADNLAGKAACKEALQQKLGLNIEPDVPLMAMVMRMTEQKGFELVMQTLDEMMQNENMQFVLLGTGDYRYEQFMREAENRYPGILCSYIGYDEELSHLVYAGSDFFLMPSRFEPCGLSQMIAMRYGSLPIVRETGGLKDSVVPYNCTNGEGSGFSFTNFDANEMRMVIHYALEVYLQKDVMKSLIENAMKEDFSFERSAKEYIKLYISMLDGYHETLPALVHELRSGNFRKPFGALRCGEKAEFSFGILSGRLLGASLILESRFGRIDLPMTQEERSYTVEFTAPEQAANWGYYFEINTKYGNRYLCADESGLSSVLLNKPGSKFRLTVFLKDFETPEWFKKSVMYQIFPDRFGFGCKSAVQQGIKYHKQLGQTPQLHKSLDEPVKYLPRKGEKDYVPDDFYGGTLAGIEKKLPYLQELGISCLYLNPITESRSNHRYDTSDYMKVDPILGTEQDFENLCRKAEAFGIKIILDGVYSHTGADSIYFNKYSHYPKNGEKPDWYLRDKNTGEYKCWWNFPELPEVDEHNSDWQNYIITGKDSVLKTWMRRGASGWRLDVADEIPDDVLALMRKAVKDESPDSPIIGEVWEDCITKTGPEGERNYALGYSLDSVMNYPLRWAVLDFLHGRKNAYQLADFLTVQKVNYPKPLYYSLMNSLTTHDLDRIRTALATDVTLRNLSREEQLNVKISSRALKKAIKLEKLAAVIQFAVPGVPCIYYGDEQGMTGVCDPFNRLPFKEDEEDTGLHNYYSDLAGLRNRLSSLQDGNAEFCALSDDVISILRYNDSGAVLAIINRGDKSATYRVDGSKAGKGIINGRIKALSAFIHEI